jgi:hypothetical protein
MENKLNEKTGEDELTNDYNLWMNNKITDKEYFLAVNRVKSK